MTDLKQTLPLLYLANPQTTTTHSKQKETSKKKLSLHFKQYWSLLKELTRNIYIVNKSL